MNSETNVLIVYISRIGKTKAIADQIESNVGGDLFEILTADSKLLTHVRNMEDYDDIFLGFSNWWGTMPKAVCSFLYEYDFSDKMIIPFCTSGGNRFVSSLQDIAKLCPGATIVKGLYVLNMDVMLSWQQVNKWLEKLGLTISVSRSSDSVWK